MRLIQLKLENFRCYKDEITIELGDLVVFVGKNDSGKSSIFDALNIFFDDKATPDSGDKCIQSEDGKVRIVCAFEDLPSELVIDAQHPTNLTKEHILNKDGYLEIVKIYDCNLAKPKCTGIFARAMHPTSDGYSDLLSLTNSKLKERAKNLGVDLKNINQTVNTELRSAIWKHSQDLQCQEVEIELKAEAAKAIWDQLKKNLPIYALFKSDRTSSDQDEEAQDPMKTAVKEAIKAQEAALNDIAEKVKIKVQEIADLTVEKIREMNPGLAGQLTPHVSNKNWDSIFSVSLTGDENIPINKRGSGTRRLVLLNFFRAKAEKEAEDKSTGLIYAIEEPETSQHPFNQVMLVKAIEELSERSGCQIFLTTHTPMLARRFSQNSLRLITQDNDHLIISHGREENTIKKIVQSLGVLPDHNIKVFFGVEGRNDINFLCILSKILHDAGENIYDLRQAEDAGQLVFVPLGGSSLDLWISRLKNFNLPEFYLIDRDNVPPINPHYKVFADEVNQRDKCTAWHTNKKELENYIHKDLIIDEYPAYAGNGSDFEDVPSLFAQVVHESSDNCVSWAEITADVEKYKKKISNAKKKLCTYIVSKMTPSLLSQVDPNNDIRNWLHKVSSFLS
jgi:putative ATP-dependent endonuclease of the OLD family